MLRLGAPVLYRGKRYILRGLDPMGVSGRMAQLEEPGTSRRISVPVEEVEPAESECAPRSV